MSRRNKRAAIIMAIICVSLVAFVVANAEEEKKTDTGVITQGAKIGDSPTVTLGDVMKNSDKFIGKTVIVEGQVQEVCQKKGCWMEVVSGDQESSIRVTFKDYGFFVPMDSHGMIARMEGQFDVKTLSKEDADHLEAEGAKITRNDDGTANELAFVATGVELRKPQKTQELDRKAEGG